MRFSVISSGSKANCTFLECGTTRILIDCGLSGLQVDKRLSSLGIDIGSVTGIVITHEHHDHVYGVPTVSRRHRVPVYANRPTAEHLKSLFGLEYFSTGESFCIGDVTINPFRITHDASDPVGFAFTWCGYKFTYVTDLGKVTPLVQDALTACNAIVIESNHDPILLQECGYPWELKQRIASTHGHLSNGEAGDAIRTALHSDLSHVVLAHLSENSNTPEHALSTVRERIAAGASDMQFPDIRCGSIAEPTPLISIVNDDRHGWNSHAGSQSDRSTNSEALQHTV